jgi:mRNA interferase MazF
MSKEIVPSKWEIWHARFNFDKSGYKYRPVIVLDIAEDILVIMVTSVTNKLHLEHDYELQDWKQAGLTKASIARLDRIATVPLNYIGTAGRIGKLSDRDVKSIETILSNMKA